MGGFVLFLFLVGLAGCFVWQFIETRNAVATTTLSTRNTPGDAARIVQAAFTGPRTVLWTTARGPGMINMRRRGIWGGITMSIDVEPGANGGSQVAMWASETAVYLVVLVNFAGVVNRRKRAIERALTEGTQISTGHS